MAKKDLILKEVCNILGKSKRTITTYIKKGLLRPEKVRGQKGLNIGLTGQKLRALKNQILPDRRQDKIKKVIQRKMTPCHYLKTI